MFHFPASTPTQTMHSPAGNTTQPVLGFPIRTSSDQRFVGNSPRHNAASHVLHRLSMPRHPPYALDKKHYKTHTQKIKMLASTIQFSHTTHHTPAPLTRAHTHTSKRHQDHKETTHVLPQTPNSMPTTSHTTTPNHHKKQQSRCQPYAFLFASHGSSHISAHQHVAHPHTTNTHHRPTIEVAPHVPVAGVSTTGHFN